MKQHNIYAQAIGDPIRDMLVINEVRDRFFESLNDVISKFDVKNNVFGVVDGKLCEPSHGYYTEIREVKDANDIRSEFNPLHSLIRVCDGKMYLGKFCESLSETRDSQGIVIDLRKKLILNI